MPRRIAILPDAVADQIAAGEVVERPASVVKELSENALDADASWVRIAVEGGGKTLVEVSDDGHGMGREDAILAVDRHATSKIKSAGDLVGVSTFGFRGEALPAIASVSRFTLLTADGETDATEVAITGGRVDRVAAAARQQGTTVSVRSLFFNTPARRKFLRSVASETRACHDVVATLALAHPSRGFDLAADGVMRLSVPPGQSPEERLAAVWGRELAGTLVPVNYAVGAFRVSGFVQRPGDAKPTGRRAQLFINGRPFKDSFLVRAAEAGYRSAIHPGDRPSLFLRIETDVQDVDVNVHPAKLEVRFRDRIGVERLVEEAVRHAIGALVAAAPVGDWRPLPQSWPRESERNFVPGEVAFGEMPEGGVGAGAPPGADSGLLELLPDPDALGAVPGAPLAAVPVGAVPVDTVPATLPIMQLFDTYIAYQGPDGLVIVDQHSAHERVIFERTMADLTGPGVAAQRLLLPVTLELTDEELARIGYDADPFGGRTVVLHTSPSPHPRFDAVACFREMVADLARGRFGGWANRLERFAATYACRAAVKAGDPLSEREMRELLSRLFATDLPPHDVHGRSTIVQLPREELERRFGRR